LSADNTTRASSLPSSPANLNGGEFPGGAGGDALLIVRLLDCSIPQFLDRFVPFFWREKLVAEKLLTTLLEN